jgi:hypothetical protein
MEVVDAKGLLWEVSPAVNGLTSLSSVRLDWEIRIACSSIMTPCRALLT